MRAAPLFRRQTTVVFTTGAGGPVAGRRSPSSPRRHKMVRTIVGRVRRPHQLIRQYSATATAMHKLQFARGIGQREFLRANTLPSITRAKVGCLARLHIYEENARFILLALLLIAYLCVGAALFHWLEHDNELMERNTYFKLRDEVYSHFCAVRLQPTSFLNCTLLLDELLDLRGKMSAAGLLNDRPSFDLQGAFYFAGTVISTIGFGMTTPRTPVGQMATIGYGFIGCTSCILFFNLFLERVVTCFSYVLRFHHDLKLKRRLRQRTAAAATSNQTEKPVTLLVNDMDFFDGSSSSFDGPEQWKPSVYKVFICLFLVCVLLISLAAILYSKVEHWSYQESLYFCFVSFATIGFGDLVSSQQANDAGLGLYRCANFVFLSLGVCCVYSLFNVASIVIRQMLNCIIKKVDVRVYKPLCCKRKKRRYMGLGLRPPEGYDSDSARTSIGEQGSPDGLISLKEFLLNNQSNMILLQKQLINSAAKNAASPLDNDQKISATRVGPMGILTQKFGDS
uniref:Potassium channel domain-containing protein n=1 Tax=Plectus sambesii TaxID=2011161 RepID=A0A914W8Z0_9BILA